MADDKHYVAGDFYRICDMTGFKIRAGRTQKQWNNIIVRDESFELRQPQDFVRGVFDDQRVPEPKPRQVNGFVGPLTELVTAAANPGDILVSITTTKRMYAGDTVGVILNNGENFRTTIGLVVDQQSLKLVGPLPFWVSPGNFFTDFSAVSPPNINGGT